MHMGRLGVVQNNQIGFAVVIQVGRVDRRRSVTVDFEGFLFGKQPSLLTKEDMQFILAGRVRVGSMGRAASDTKRTPSR